MPLEAEIRSFTSRKDGARIARLRDGCFHEGRVITAAVKTVLDPQSASWTEIARPLSIEFSFKVESALLVGEVPRCDQKCKANPEKERVESKERAIVEEDASPAKDGGDCCRCRGCSRENEFGAVTHADNVGAFKDVKPGHQAENETCESIHRQL